MIISGDDNYNARPLLDEEPAITPQLGDVQDHDHDHKHDGHNVNDDDDNSFYLKRS